MSGSGVRLPLVGVVLIALAAGLLLGRISYRASKVPSPSTTTTETPTSADNGAAQRPGPGTGAGPSGETAGIDVGFSRSEEGARAAAMSYATASQRWLYMSDAEIEAAMGAIATPGASRRLADEVVSEIAVARDGLSASPGRIWWIVRPLASRVDSYTEERARMSVWTVTVLSAADVALPQSDWLTVTVDLEWHAGDWRVSAVDDQAGPTPMVGVRDEPWEPEPFDEALDGFERVGS